MRFESGLKTDFKAHFAVSSAISLNELSLQICFAADLPAVY
jgi:hypothetical protein